MQYFKTYTGNGRYVIWHGEHRYIAVCDDFGRLVAIW